MTKVSEHFSEGELRCSSTGGLAFHEGFIKHLEKLRIEYALPMVVTSCCRSADYNTRIKGHPRSLHIYDNPAHGADGTLALDISRPNGTDLAHLVHMGLLWGWSVGIANTFIHLDRRRDIGMEQRIFTYA